MTGSCIQKFLDQVRIISYRFFDSKEKEFLGMASLLKTEPYPILIIG
jgi:hypothetical protein